MLLFEEFQAESGKRKAAGLGHSAKAPRHQGEKFQVAEVSVAFTTMEALKLYARPKKHGWCAPIRRHSSRSDVSRLGCTTRASRNVNETKRNQASDDCCKAHICAYRPLSANKAACDPRSTMRPASSTKISWASTTVDKRCAITKVVLLCAALCNSP